MDPQTDLPDLVEDLEVNIDELSTTLTPLLPPNTLSKTATSLPLLEKAKLHVLAAYSIESLLFSALQASGADAKAHPIFRELSRLKGYFAKIKDAEENAQGPRHRLDKDAAARFIKHGLSGNERYDELRKERLAKEKERALEKARAVTNKKFVDDDDNTPRKRGADAVEDDDGTPNKKSRLDAVHSDPAAPPNTTIDADEDENADAAAAAEPTPTPAKKKRGRPSKKDKATATAADDAEASTPQKPDIATPTRATRSSAPKTRGEAPEASKGTGGSGKGKGRGKGKSKGT